MTEAAVVSWAAAKLGEEQLNLRRGRVTEHLGAQPSASIPVVCGGWAETQGAYWLLTYEALTGAGGHAGRGAVGVLDAWRWIRNRETCGADKSVSNASKALQRIQSHRPASRKIPENLPSRLRNLPGK